MQCLDFYGGRPWPLACGLAFIDVDNLKAKNDSLGHPAGDKLLRDTADSIRAHLRSYDLLIRFGGDEFLCGLMGRRWQRRPSGSPW